jgi:single-strand DNA-binding protein
LLCLIGLTQSSKRRETYIRRFFYHQYQFWREYASVEPYPVDRAPGQSARITNTPTGRKVTKFSLAVDNRWRSQAGEEKESTDWFSIEAWGRLGEICEQYLHKGSLVYLEGPVHTERYEHQGETRYYTKVVARRLQMLGKPAEDEPIQEEEEEPVLE